MPKAGVVELPVGAGELEVVVALLADANEEVDVADGAGDADVEVEVLVEDGLPLGRFVYATAGAMCCVGHFVLACVEVTGLASAAVACEGMVAALAIAVTNAAVAVSAEGRGRLPDRWDERG